jgi:hypothetical protein
VNNRILWLMTVAGLVICAVAFAKKEKVGVVKDGWYSDSRFGFSVFMPSDWKDAGAKDEPSPERIAFIWRKARIPLKLKNNPNEALKPFVRIFADSTTMSAREFLDSLNVGSTKDSYRDKILSKSTFFERGLSNPPEITPAEAVKIGGRDALRWHVRREYSVQYQKDEVTPPQLIRDYRVGYVYIIPGEGTLLYLEMACENQFRDDMEGEFQKVVSSITFSSATPKSDSTAVLEKGENK